MIRYLTYLLGREDLTSGQALERLETHHRFRCDIYTCKRAIKYGESSGMLDDKRLLSQLIYIYQSKHIGPIKIQQKLHKKKFDAQLLSETKIQLKKIDFTPSAIHLLLKRFGQKPIMLPEKNKVVSFLLRRGFTLYIAEQAFEHLYISKTSI